MEKLVNYKIVIVGHSSVGKSCILLRFTDDRFTQNYQPTIGVDFKFRKLILEEDQIRLQIWDTAGQEKYQAITKTFYKDTSAVVVVFDLSSQETFLDLEKNWLSEIKRNCDNDVQLMLLGNKSDLNVREVNNIQAEDFAKQHNMDYFETSAKEGTNIEMAFIHLTRKIHQNKKSQKNNVIQCNELQNKEKQVLEKKCC